MYKIPYFFYMFDHLKITNFFADRIIGITPKLTENLEPNTIVYQTHRYMYVFWSLKSEEAEHI